MRLYKDDVSTPLRPNQIGEQLPYFEFEYNPDSPLHRVHLLKNGSFGIAWKCPVPASYSYDNGHHTTTNELRTFLEGIPVDYHAQIIITSHNNLSEKMTAYLEAKNDDAKSKLLKRSRAEKLLNAGFSGYQVSESSYSMLRDTYMIMTLYSPPQHEKLGAISQLINTCYQIIATVLSAFKINFADMVAGFLDETIKLGMSEFQEILLTTETTLNTMFQLERMTLEEMKAHYWHAYCPSYKEPIQKTTIDKKISFNEQIFPLPIEHGFDVIKIGDDYHGLVMMAMMPDAIDTDYMGILRRTLATQVTFFSNIYQANQGMEKAALTIASALKQRVAGAFSKEEAATFAQEASDVKSRMFGGRKIMYTMVGVIIHGYSREEVSERCLRMAANFKKLSIVPDVEKSMALQGISYSWPFAWEYAYSKPFSRTRRVLSDDLIDLLPIHGHWGGHKDPQAVYANRDGELTFFDHTSADFVNWHYAITGTSGSGKSFAVVDLALQLYSSGVAKQYLITIKDDYDRFAETMGTLVVIDLDKPESCINPFGGEINKNRLQQWCTTVELMLQRGAEGVAGTDLQRLIEQILQYAYDLVPEGDVLRTTWIREAFYKFPYATEEQREMGMRNAEEIGSYCEGEVYGALFDGPPAIDENDKLVVFNLQNVLSEKISDVIVNAVFTMLDNVMYMGDRKERKHLLVDEMISMISAKGGDAVGNQVKRAFRTYRSLNCMCGIATQNEDDLNTDVGQAVIGNVTKRIMLMPKKEMIPMLMQALSLRSERHEANLASLETKPGFYSEFYLMSPHGEVVCRLLTDKLTYALATTTPDDTGEIQRLYNENGGDYWRAAVDFSEMYPNGVRAAMAAIKKQQEEDAA